ncbi:MAG TPA: transposase, partial [Methylomusa anaerophila]
VFSRKIFVFSHETAKYGIQDLLEVHYPHAKRIRLVMDNLNTHTVASLYEAFAPSKALELSKRLEIHYTPKHGSWLNIAEIELSALTLQCLDRRIPSIEILQQQLSAWEAQRNAVKKISGLAFYYGSGPRQIEISVS